VCVCVKKKISILELYSIRGYHLEEACEHCFVFLDYQYKGCILQIQYHCLSYLHFCIYIYLNIAHNLLFLLVKYTTSGIRALYYESMCPNFTIFLSLDTCSNIFKHKEDFHSTCKIVARKHIHMEYKWSHLVGHPCISHRGPKGFINAQNSIIPNSLEKNHQCVELDDSFPMVQKLPQTEFICKSFGQSKFKSTRSKVKVKGLKVTCVTNARVTLAQP
jgi:hypothetical protein